MIQQEDILYGRIATSGQPGPRGPKGDPGGVVTWNERDGVVVPLAGDYTSGMVNAVDITAVITNEDIEALFN